MSETKKRSPPIVYPLRSILKKSKMSDSPALPLPAEEAENAEEQQQRQEMDMSSDAVGMSSGEEDDDEQPLHDALSAEEAPFGDAVATFAAATFAAASIAAAAPAVAGQLASPPPTASSSSLPAEQPPPPPSPADLASKLSALYVSAGAPLVNAIFWTVFMSAIICLHPPTSEVLPDTVDWMCDMQNFDFAEAVKKAFFNKTDEDIQQKLRDDLSALVNTSLHEWKPSRDNGVTADKWYPETTVWFIWSHAFMMSLNVLLLPLLTAVRLLLFFAGMRVYQFAQSLLFLTFLWEMFTMVINAWKNLPLLVNLFFHFVPFGMLVHYARHPEAKLVFIFGEDWGKVYVALCIIAWMLSASLRTIRRLWRTSVFLVEVVEKAKGRRANN